MIYLDSSAVVKLVHEEPESGALESWLSQDDRPLVTSVLTEIEVKRALRRSDPDALPLVPEIIDGLYRFDIDGAVRRVAARFAERTLRTLDAVHLATALEFGAELDAFVCYDQRLLAAATTQGSRWPAPASDSDQRAYCSPVVAPHPRRHRGRPHRGLRRRVRSGSLACDEQGRPAS